MIIQENEDKSKENVVEEENDGISGSLGRQFWQADYKPRMCEYA